MEPNDQQTKQNKNWDTNGVYLVIFLSVLLHINVFLFSVLFLLHLFSLPVCITSSSSSSSSSKTSHATKCSVVVIYMHALSFFCRYSNNLFDTMFAFTFVLRTAKVCCMEVFCIFFYLNIKFKWNEVVGRKKR